MNYEYVMRNGRTEYYIHRTLEGHWLVTFDDGMGSSLLVDGKYDTKEEAKRVACEYARQQDD